MEPSVSIDLTLPEYRSGRSATSFEGESPYGESNTANGLTEAVHHRNALGAGDREPTAGFQPATSCLRNRCSSS